MADASTPELEGQQAWLPFAFEQGLLGVARVASDGRIVAANQAFAKMLGWQSETLRGRELLSFVSEVSQAEMRERLFSRIDAPPSPIIEVGYVTRDGALL